MNQQELINKLEYILDNSKTGILSTIDENGRSHMRWMTPVLIKGRKGVIFSITSQQSEKVIEISQRPDVTWIIQTRSLDQIITLKGITNILDNPSIKSELIELMGDKLTMFWKINKNSMDFVVMETIIKEAVYFQPMTGSKQVVEFE